MIDDVLAQAGLDSKESAVYTTLLNHGGLTVLEIANKSGLKRTNLYNTLEKLKHLNLVAEINEDNTTKYFPQSPREVEKLLERRAQQVNHAKLNYEILINSLQSQFTLIEHKPAITTYEGLAGLKKLYADINNTGKDILLFRSTYDDKRQDVDDLIAEQIVEQVKRGIHAKVVGPLEDEEEARLLYTEYDKARLVEERYIKNFPFNLPAQILVYGTKVAISTIRKEIIITVMDNKDISDTYRVLFDFVWKYSEREHGKIVKQWAKTAK